MIEFVVEEKWMKNFTEDIQQRSTFRSLKEEVQKAEGRHARAHFGVLQTRRDDKLQKGLNGWKSLKTSCCGTEWDRWFQIILCVCVTLCIMCQQVCVCSTKTSHISLYPQQWNRKPFKTFQVHCCFCCSTLMLDSGYMRLCSWRNNKLDNSAPLNFTYHAHNNLLKYFFFAFAAGVHWTGINWGHVLW